MMLAIVALAAPMASLQVLEEARLALNAGRAQQAREMIAVAVEKGAHGSRVDRLLADLANVEGDWQRALAGYKRLLIAKPGDHVLQQRAGIAALNGGALSEAVALLDKATAASSADWRTWNARAVAADWQRDWRAADAAYARARALAPNNGQVLNNQGWSFLLRGYWDAALEPLSRAAAAAPTDRRIAANLDLARAAASATLPARRAGESNNSYAARLNDAGVIAARSGNRQKAIAAFAQALEASDRWFARAANNLKLLEPAP